MQKRYVYILQNDDCEILEVATSVKKIQDQSAGKYQLLPYRKLMDALTPKKKKGETLVFEGRDNNTYRLSAHRIQ